MSEPGKIKLHRPWLVAGWPGMGNVALNACVYLLAKLDMTLIAELSAEQLFDVDHIEVRQGIVGPVRRPRNRFFAWRDPNQRHDLVVFLGEAQPPIGKYAFCRQLVAFAKELAVERLFAFAAMATPMHPEHPSRVFVAATEQAGLDALKEYGLALLDDGYIGGLNGVILGAAEESGLSGTCLLGEIPHLFNQLPFPKASLAILEVLTRVMDIPLDFTELTEQAQIMERQLSEFLARMEQTQGAPLAERDEGFRPEPDEDARLSVAHRRKLEELFAAAAQDRAKAFELKALLDKFGVFKEYEDRFLDLFKRPE